MIEEVLLPCRYEWVYFTRAGSLITRCHVSYQAQWRSGFLELISSIFAKFDFIQSPEVHSSQLEINTVFRRYILAPYKSMYLWKLHNNKAMVQPPTPNRQVIPTGRVTGGLLDLIWRKITRYWLFKLCISRKNLMLTSKLKFSRLRDSVRSNNERIWDIIIPKIHRGKQVTLLHRAYFRPQSRIRSNK